MLNISPHSKKEVIMKTVMLALLFVLFFSLSYGTVFTVNLLLPDNPALFQYHTLAAAYAAASNGDVIRVYPGDYTFSQPSELVSGAKTLVIEGTTLSSTWFVANSQTIISLTGGTLTVKNIVFQSNDGDGIKIVSGNPTLKVYNCIFDSCNVGIYAYATSTVDIQGCVFRSCERGVYFYRSLSLHSVYGAISNCIFHDNTIGMYVNDSEMSSYVDVFNSVFVSNTEYSIRRNYSPFYGVVSYNIFYLNGNDNNLGGISYGTGNLVDVSPTLMNISGNPYYNYFPAAGSPCVDNGNPDSDYTDADQTQNDIGIFGGPHPWGAGMPVILYMQATPGTVQQGGTFNLDVTGRIK